MSNQILNLELKYGEKTIDIRLAARCRNNIRSCNRWTLPKEIQQEGSLNISCADDNEIDSETPLQIYVGNDSDLPWLLLLEETPYEIQVKSDLMEECVFPYLRNNNDDSLSVEQSILKTRDSGSYFYNLNFKSYVGKGFFDFEIEDKKISIPFEVRSKKLEYRADYMSMMSEISSFTSALLLKSNAPLFMGYDFSHFSSSTRYEDFLVLDHIMQEHRLPSVYEYLRKNLYDQLITIEEVVPSSLAYNVSPASIINSISANNLMKSDNGTIAGKYSITELNAYGSYETIDTPENRLIKDFLMALYDLSSSLMESQSSEQSAYVNSRLKKIIMLLEEYLSDAWLSEVGDLRYIPFNSTILQKRQGYSDMFEMYLLMGIGLKFRFEDTSDLIEGHNKKLHRVYEYWCFLKLFDTVKNLSSNKPDYELEKEDDTWGMTIKSNKSEFFYTAKNKVTLRIELHYNKEFKRPGRKPFQSYSLKMRPDYTLAIYPDSSADESCFIIHFDAKYKQDKTKLDEGDDPDSSETSYRKDDIYRMHTYRDGLLRSWGSFILYPGEEYEIFERYEYFGSANKEKGLLPSVGAVPLVPGDRMNIELSSLLESIFEDIAVLSDHVFDGEFVVGEYFYEK